MKRISIPVLMTFVIWICTALILFQSGCKDNPVDAPIKNPREYKWDVAVLSYPMSGQTTMYSIWGSSSKDVYVCGHNSVAGYGKMYHFDGNGWSPVYLPYGFFDLSQMTGFTSTDIWATGLSQIDDPNIPMALLDSALILHYDGAKWSQIFTPFKLRGLQSVWGTSSSNLYFGSKNGTVLHFDGSQWSLDTLYKGLSIQRMGGDQTKVFAFGNTYRGRSDDSVMCYMGKVGSWNLLDLQLRDQFYLTPRFGFYSIYSPSSGDYFSTSFGIFRWIQNKWEKVLSIEGSFGGLTGTGINNMIAVGTGNQGPLIYSWNGNDWANVELPAGILPRYSGISDVWTNGTEAFAVANDGTQSYVIHGK